MRKIFMGLTGSIASGKGVVSDFLKKKGFVYMSLSDELREVARERKVELTRKNLQDLGNSLRAEEGSEALAKYIGKKIDAQQYSKAVIDGIRNPGEVNYLRNNLKNFFLIAVDAPEQIRFERMFARNRESDPRTLEDFLVVDRRDKGIGEAETGQGVGKCMALADYNLINDKDFESISAEIEKLYEKIDCGLPRPNWDEYFIGMMHEVASRATCNRGRSGCVVAKDKLPLITGYVGSPPGVDHCDEIGHQMKQMIHEDGKITSHCVRTTHAEQNAIARAARKGIALEGATIYVSMTPCYTCAKLIITAGIERVVCEKKYHAGADSEELFKKTGTELVFLSDETMKYSKQ
jgi:dCMP deaminase